MKPELTVITIVLVGRFDPSKFSAALLSEANAISSEDAAAAQYEFLIPGQALGLTFPWGKFQVETERVLVETAQVPFVRALDLAVKAVREMAPQSLVFKFGVNVASHFKFPSVAARDEFAMRLVPAAHWGEFGSRVLASLKNEGDKHGGVIRVTMRQPVPEGRTAGWFDVTIEPSPAIPNSQGVAILTNDHFEHSSEELDAMKRSGRVISESMIDSLISNFDSSIEKSLEVSEALAGQQ